MSTRQQSVKFATSLSTSMLLYVRRYISLDQCFWLITICKQNLMVQNSQYHVHRPCTKHHTELSSLNYMIRSRKFYSNNWYPRHFKITHHGLVMPYDDIYVGQHWLRKWLVAWWHQAITGTNVDLSQVRSSDINLGAISQKPWISKISLKITYKKFHKKSQEPMS